MKRISKTIYQTPDEIEGRIRQLETFSMRLRADTDQHRKIMKEIAQLSIYAAAKRWLSGAIKHRRKAASVGGPPSQPQL